MIKNLKGKTALITGASQRIGKAISLALAGEGVNILVHYKASPEETDGLRLELSARKNLPNGKIKSWIVKADFSNPEEYRTLIKRSMELAGRIDILVNNASIFSADTINDVEFDSVINKIEINSWVPFLLTRDFATLAQGPGRSVINVLDSRIKGYDRNHVSYILSKHVLRVVTEMCALHFAPDISINAIAPGLILPPAGKTEDYLMRLAETVPLKRHGGPDDIAQAAIWLLRNDFMTGQIVFVDGGRHLQEHEKWTA